jgi:hypothetical protein
MNLLPGPDAGGPLSISQELGASTANTGIEEFSIAEIISGKGSRRGPPKEKPKIASMMRDVLGIADWKSDGFEMTGTDRAESWVFRRA